MIWFQFFFESFPLTPLQSGHSKLKFPYQSLFYRINDSITAIRDRAV